MRKLITDLEAIRKFVSSDGKLDKSEVSSLLSFIQRHIKEEGYKNQVIENLEKDLKNISSAEIDEKTAKAIFDELNDLIFTLKSKYWKTSLCRFFMYLGRWQLSTPIYSIVLYVVSDKFGYTQKTIIANLIGGCIFYWIDKFIFSKTGKK